MLTGTSIQRPRALGRYSHAHNASKGPRVPRRLQVCAALPSRTDQLRELLAGPDIIKVPLMWDPCTPVDQPPTPGPLLTTP